MRYRVGILGATGTVGQRLVQHLADHPWFAVTEVAASGESAGKTYEQATRWRLTNPMPAEVKHLFVKEVAPNLDCELVFSSLDAAVAGSLEEQFARAGYPVISNSRNHRMDKDVPLIIPEVNPGHLEVLDYQKKRRGYSRGFLVTNPNCSTIGLALPLKALDQVFGVEKVFVVTLQAISGAGYPGVPALDAIDNIIPFIPGEEAKIETETGKILGDWHRERFLPASIVISAQCNRVPVRDGHLGSVSVKLRQKAPPDEVASALRSFVGEPQRLRLPSAPERPVLVREENNRPQTRLDRDEANGMAVVVGRVRTCPLLDIRFSFLMHNLLRGAAGAAILNAELVVRKGYLPERSETRERGSQSGHNSIRTLRTEFFRF